MWKVSWRKYVLTEPFNRTAALPSTLIAQSITPTSDEISSSMATFQELIAEAVPKRDTKTLAKVNSIFDNIYGIANGTIRDAGSSSIQTTAEQRIRLLCSCFSTPGKPVCATKLTAVPVKDAIKLLNAWADGDNNLVLTIDADFTLEHTIQLAEQLKDVTVAWRSFVDNGKVPRSISARNAAADLVVYEGNLEKRTLKKAIEVGLKVLAALLSAIADVL